MNSLKPHLMFGLKVLAVLAVYAVVKPIVVRFLPANLAAYLP
jgi:hypothetical protein